jgi:hypothetical protein
MNLKKIVWRHQYFFLLAILFEIRAIWQYLLSPDVHLLLVDSSIALSFLVLPFPLLALSAWLERAAESKKIVGSVFVFLFGCLAVSPWGHHSKIWAALDVFLGAFLLFVIWKDRIFPDSDARRQERRAKVRAKFENLCADRDAFEKDWESRVKIGEGIILLLCAILAVFCWITLSKMLAIVPALFGALFLIGLFATLTPMSDEKFEKELAEAKARFAHVEARRAKFDARRAKRAERREERKNGQKPSRPSWDNFASFIYLSAMLCFFWFKDRPHLERPDVVFCALPAWYLIRAVYFLIREQSQPRGPDVPLVSESPTAGQ